jgi:soluble lytic murein transglycosylase
MEEGHRNERSPAGAPHRNWHRIFVLIAMPLLAFGLLWTTQAAPAKEVVGALRLRHPAVLQTTPSDPVHFLSQLELVMPKPVLPLSVGDAVAKELMSQSRTLSEQDALRTAQALVEESMAVGYDPLLVLALIYVESYYDHFAVSPVGAEGLMQIMPPTGEFMAAQMGLERTQGHTFDPVLNVRLGTRYLALLRRQFGGSVELALTAYNRGPSNTYFLLRQFGGHLPEAVRDVYAGKVLRRYGELRAAYGALPVT